MKKWKLVGTLAVAAIAVMMLAACGNKNLKEGSSTNKFSAALVTNVGGIDDKSFVQSAWEGMQKFGKENGMTKGVGSGHYNYFQSNTESDYTPNINQAIQGKYELIYGVGFAIKQAIEDAAKQHPNQKFAMIDDTIKLNNVVSTSSRDEEAAYLAGVAAANTSKTQKIGYIGGVQSAVLDRFEAGFVAGAQSVNKNIKVDRQYVGSFVDAAKGKSMAHAMFANGVDVIYQAAGTTGFGVFSEAKAINETKNADAKDKVWVIGVDMDQLSEGDYKSKDGKKANFTLASTEKNVGAIVEQLNKETMDGKFPGGKALVYGLADGGLSLAKDSMSDEVWQKVETAKKAIIDGTVKVPTDPAKLKS
jgi:basic membrane protein A